MSNEVRLQVKNVCKSFGITKAVQNVSFNINKGEVHALIGENGSGKSTLTNMLTGIYPIDSGTFIPESVPSSCTIMETPSLFASTWFFG